MRVIAHQEHQPCPCCGQHQYCDDCGVCTACRFCAPEIDPNEPGHPEALVRCSECERTMTHARTCSFTRAAAADCRPQMRGVRKRISRP